MHIAWENQVPMVIKDAITVRGRTTSEIWCTIASAYHTPLRQLPNTWVIDSGATEHITNDNTILIFPSPCTRIVKTAGGMLIGIKAREWINANVITWQNDTGFQWQKTSTYNSKQNGKAE
ncbi:hypothetical protein NDA17_005852 [Ustilago hordei]|nr:hypothetical protein NDA17_005852 [Ustilago hordei]